jgi:hypothetical protein
MYRLNGKTTETKSTAIYSVSHLLVIFCYNSIVVGINVLGKYVSYEVKKKKKEQKKKSKLQIFTVLSLPKVLVF